MSSLRVKPFVRLRETREVFDICASEFRIYIPYLVNGELRGILIGIRRSW